MVSHVLILLGFKECMDYMNTILFVFLCKTVEEIGALKLCSSLKNMCGYCFHGSLVKLKQVVYDIVLVVFVSQNNSVCLNFTLMTWGVGGQWNCTLDKKYKDLSVVSSALQIKFHAFVGFHESGWRYVLWMTEVLYFICVHLIYVSANFTCMYTLHLLI